MCHHRTGFLYPKRMPDAAVGLLFISPLPTASLICRGTPRQANCASRLLRHPPDAGLLSQCGAESLSGDESGSSLALRDRRGGENAVTLRATHSVRPRRLISPLCVRTFPG